MHFFQTLCRHFSSLPKLSKLKNVPYKLRRQTVWEAQNALTDYLHTTRSLSFTIAEHISKNSLFSLSQLISRLDFCPSHFPKDFTRFLRYHPINEFEFFFESIGIPPPQIQTFLPPNDFFLSEEGNVLNVARALWAFGFPWNKLGKLYNVFGNDPKLVTDRLHRFKTLGFTTVSVIGICLNFPFVLCGNDELSSEANALLLVMKRVLVDSNLKSFVEDNVDVSYAICRKIKLFYDLGCELMELGELLEKRWKVFVDCSEDLLVEKLDYFARLKARKEHVVLLILRNPEILNFDLENPVFSVVDYLKYIGVSEKELKSIEIKYPYVLGKNRLRNLPHVMRALDLHDWFFEKIMNGGHHLLVVVDVGSSEEKMEKDFQDCLDVIKTMKNRCHTMSKLDFLLGVGFGENLDTMKALSYIHGTKSELQERFDCLLDLGIELSQLCKMINIWPKFLNQNPDMLKDKINFLRNYIGCSFGHLDAFPGYLCFDLENRSIPRFRMHKWLKEKGLTKKEYSLSSILATSEKMFIARLFTMHPAVPKLWLEVFSHKEHPCIPD